ncbi:uncharacterized protein LOC120296598 [Eucalyptus grandis]|uniref:uncharacterized protein LOC120296598 n=1 Tax=Eucalyptus grandis TaxID=71139 RepID=UPI00192ECDAA|nr:uncharacterized protein LOC120296598 [Eucalyptus grandis]
MFFVEVEVGGRTLYALVDTGASNMFMSTEVAKALGLHVEPSGKSYKPINSGDFHGIGATPDVDVKIGGWRGRMAFEVIPLDDYDLILGMQFFKSVGAMIDMRTKCMMILDQKCPSMIPMIKRVVDTKTIESIRRLDKSLKAVMRINKLSEVKLKVELDPTPTHDMPIQALFPKVECAPRAPSKPKTELRTKSDFIIEGCGPSFVSVRAKRNKHKRDRAKARKATRQAESDEDVARLSGGECHGPRDGRPERFPRVDPNSPVDLPRHTIPTEPSPRTLQGRAIPSLSHITGVCSFHLCR